MSINLEDYMHLVQNEGDFVYTKHLHCPASNGGPDHKPRLWLKIIDHKLIGHCHHCSNSRVVPYRVKKSLFKESLQRMLPPFPVDLGTDKTVLCLPPDYTTDLPGHALLYLFKYLSVEEIERYDIGYSKYLNRVIYPIYTSNKFWDYCLGYWQGRSLEQGVGKQEKYLGPKGHKSVPFRTGPQAKDIIDCCQFPTIIIVEDILSAIKVGRHVDTIATLGTHLSEAVKKQLLTEYEFILVWYDKDAEKKSLYLSNHLNKLVHSRSIVTDYDPKDLSDYEIQREIERCMNQ